MKYHCRIDREVELESDLKGSLSCPKCKRIVQDPGYHDIEIKTQPKASLEAAKPYKQVVVSHNLNRKEQLAASGYVREDELEFPLEWDGQE